MGFQLFIYNAERLCQELITFTSVQREGRKRERKSQSRRRNKRIQREKKTTEEKIQKRGSQKNCVRDEMNKETVLVCGKCVDLNMNRGLDD